MARPAWRGALSFGLVSVNVGLYSAVSDHDIGFRQIDRTTQKRVRYRKVAEGTQSDLKALAACIRGSRQTLTAAEAAAILTPALIAIGTKDEVAGDPHRLAAMMGNARAFDIDGRDHNLAVGDRTFKQVALAFLRERP